MADEEPGWFKLWTADSLGNNEIPHHVSHTDLADISTTDIHDNTLIPPAPKVRASEDMRMYIGFKSEVADIVESEECTVLLPITLIRLSDGFVDERHIGLEEMTGFKPSGGVDRTVETTHYTPLAYYPCPRGYEIYWGHLTLRTSHCRVYMGDDT